jgi:hypothetical protein
MRQNVSLNKNGNVFVVWRHKNILKLLWKFCSGKDRKINMTYRNGGCADTLGVKDENIFVVGQLDIETTLYRYWRKKPKATKIEFYCYE